MRRGSTPDAWGAFLAWAAFGAVAALSYFVIGVLDVLLFIGAVVLVAVRPSARDSVVGLLAGVGGFLLYVAYLQRLGPGTVCWQTARASGCDEYLDPLPWLGAGVVCVVAGVAIQVHRRRRTKLGLGA